MQISVEVVIALLTLIIVALGTTTTILMKLRKDAGSEGKKEGEITQKLDNVLTLLCDMKANIEQIGKDNSKNKERIIRLETVLEQAGILKREGT